MGKVNAYKILVGKPKGKTPLGGYRLREDNIGLYLRMGGMDWIHLAQGWGKLWAPVNMVIIVHVPCKAVNFLTN
jgi:hypothetical protein